MRSIKDFVLENPGIQTPYYLYDSVLLQNTLNECMSEAKKWGFLVHYAIKANHNEKILSRISSLGFGADCVSGNEVVKAVACGFSSKKTVFAGVGKSDEEIRKALKLEISEFNVESIEELKVINEIAGSMGKIAQVALRLNPNVPANTHKYITTGLEENKFGINISDLPAILSVFTTLENVKIIGLHFHIGSQITDMEGFKKLCIRANELNQWAIDHGFNISKLNMGGGLGVDYHHPDEFSIPDFKSYFEVFKSFLQPKSHQKVCFELGRSLVAQCGNLISKVLYVKKGTSKDFIILDAGMTELLRPALYQAFHKIEALTSNHLEKKYDVVGPVCESSDCFGKDVYINACSRNDLVVIRTAGAYGEVMANGYNLRKLNPSIFV